MSEINPIDHKSIKARHFPRDNTRFLCEKRVYFNFNDWSWNIPFSHTKFFPLLTQKFLTFRTSRIFQSPCGHIGFMISVGIWCWGAGNFAMFCCNQELVKAFAKMHVSLWSQNTYPVSTAKRACWWIRAKRQPAHVPCLVGYWGPSSITRSCISLPLPSWQLRIFSQL